MRSVIVAKKELPILDESLFYQLLEGPGMVEVNVTMLEQYFVPFVSFLADELASRIEYGVIVRNKTDVLAARTVGDLLILISEMTARTPNLTVIFCDPLAPGAGPHRR